MISIEGSLHDVA